MNSLRRSSNAPPRRISERTCSMPPLALAASRIFMRIPVVSCRSSASSEERTAVPAWEAPLIASASRRACMRSAVKTPSLSRRPPVGVEAAAAASGGAEAAEEAPAVAPGVGAVCGAGALVSGRRRLSRMLLTASRSRREGVGARVSLEAAALEIAALETVAGAAGEGGSGRRRPPVRAAATIAAPFSGATPCGLREASFGWSWAFGEEGTTGVDRPC